MIMRMMSHKTRKDRRKEYTGAKRYDASCRCHGSCPTYHGDRVYFDKRMRAAADAQVQEWKTFWNPEEYPNGTTNSTDPDA